MTENTNHEDEAMDVGSDIEVSLDDLDADLATDELTPETLAALADEPDDRPDVETPTAEIIQPTQVRFPGITTIRTILQVAIPVLLTLLVLLPQIFQILLEVDGLPTSVYAWLLGASAFIAAVAGALTKIMALPMVNEWLRKWGLAAPGTVVVDSTSKDTAVQVTETGNVVVAPKAEIEG